MPPPPITKQPPFSMIQDAEVREMFAMAGIRVDNDEEVRNFARIIRRMFQQEEHENRKKANRSKIIGIVATCAVTSLIAWAVPEFFPVLLEVWKHHP